jgi:hypothetical protein
MEEKNKKIYTIRGIDPKTYEAFTKLAKELNINLGKLVSEAMRLTLAITETTGKKSIKKLLELTGNITRGFQEEPNDENLTIVTGIKEMEVTRKDLETVEKPIVFLNMRRLEFADDVTWELLDEKVKQIKLVETLVVPEHIPKLKIAGKCLMVDRIISRPKK